MSGLDFWHVDVRIKGEWRPKQHSERSLDAARRRADSVFHWATVRVSNPITRETWTREPGRAWTRVEPDRPAPPPADPRRPTRAPENATAPQPNYWWKERE